MLRFHLHPHPGGHWSAPWTGDPVRSDAPVAIGPMLATDAGFLGWNDQLWFSNDGVSWAPNPLPDDAGPVTGAFAVDGGAIIISMADDGTAIVYRVDAMGGSAERLEIAGLPRNVQPWMSGDAAIVFDASEPPMQTTETLVVEVDGYRLEVPPMTGEFRLVDAATGAVVVADDIRDPEAAESSPFQFGPNGITVSDPETGEVVVTIPNDVYEAALQDLYGDPAESEYAPEIWLLASRDGERFVVEPVGGEIHSTVASNAGRVLFRIDGDGWASITLP